MGVSNREPLRVREESACDWNEGLAKDHRRHCTSPEPPISVIECLRKSPVSRGVERLKIVGRFAVPVEPSLECENRCLHSARERTIDLWNRTRILKHRCLQLPLLLWRDATRNVRWVPATVAKYVELRTDVFEED